MKTSKHRRHLPAPSLCCELQSWLRCPCREESHPFRTTQAAPSSEHCPVADSVDGATDLVFSCCKDGCMAKPPNSGFNSRFEEVLCVTRRLRTQITGPDIQRWHLQGICLGTIFTSGSSCHLPRRPPTQRIHPPSMTSRSSTQ